MKQLDLTSCEGCDNLEDMDYCNHWKRTVSHPDLAVNVCKFHTKYNKPESVVSYPAARNNATESSKKAANILELTGKRATRQQYAIYCVLHYPGLTANDYLHKYLKILFPRSEFNAWSGRFSECEDAGLLYREGVKVSEFTQTEGDCLYPTDEAIYNKERITQWVRNDMKIFIR